jgi:phosphoribosyl 1,2-cyclic phosphodiesterase
MFGFSVLASGSSGNSIYFEADKEKFLVDCGISAKQLCYRLNLIGKEMQGISNLLVTHEHTDHIQGVDILSRKYNLNLFFKEKTFKATNLFSNNIHIFDDNDVIEFNGVRIENFKTSHDAVDSCGFIIEYNSKRVGIVTDLGIADNFIKKQISDINALIIETNYDIKMLENGPYPLFLKKRIKSKIGHLSNTAAAELIYKSADSRLKDVFLAHLSENNNQPFLAYNTLYNKIRERDDLGNLNVYLTSRYKPTKFFRLE